MRPTFYASVLIAVLSVAPLAAPPVLAGEHGSSSEEEQSAEEMAREGMEKILRALERMMDTVPMYEMPEVTEDGDIIIRRKNPPKRDEDDEPEAEEAPAPDATET
jgi:hypothetical protein